MSIRDSITKWCCSNFRSETCDHPNSILMTPTNSYLPTARFPQAPKSARRPLAQDLFASAPRGKSGAAPDLESRSLHVQVEDETRHRWRLPLVKKTATGDLLNGRCLQLCPWKVAWLPSFFGERFSEVASWP